MLNALHCIALTAALCAICFIDRRPVACCWVWACTTALWACSSVMVGLFPHAAVDGVAFLGAVYGIVACRARKRPGDEEAVPGDAEASVPAAIADSPPDPLADSVAAMATRPSP